jgi:hypothetical protein
VTHEHLDAILKSAGAKPGDGGFLELAGSATFTLYAAKDGANLTVPKVEGLKLEGELLVAKTKGGGAGAGAQMLYLVRTDVFAVAVDLSATQPPRRAGFG